jgi:hypothetical protein
MANPCPACPRCGFEYSWDGVRCTVCKYPADEPLTNFLPGCFVLLLFAGLLYGIYVGICAGLGAFVNYLASIAEVATH